MSISTISRFSGGNRETLLALAKQGKPILEKAGADLVRMAQIYTGPHAGDLLVRVGYPNWEAYGKAQHSLAHNHAYQAIMSEVSGYLADRVVVVGIDL
jgi:hypothetical protein